MSGLSTFVRCCVFSSAAALVALILVATTAHADGPNDEKLFIAAARQLPMYVLPNGRYSTDEDILAGGYRACVVLDQHPNDPMTAARVYYHGGNTVDGKITDDGFSFMKYAAAFLCDRNFGMFNDV
ncbi:MAG: DUF732 domain-containing protein [Mycobacterium sp.]|nr:DUF732 domain-containing protein [Mycobacterium sp.]MBV9353142.1 DUF732 domain-containing protein [Mycobacterium sp.]